MVRQSILLPSGKMSKQVTEQEKNQNQPATLSTN